METALRIHVSSLTDGVCVSVSACVRACVCVLVHMQDSARLTRAQGFTNQIYTFTLHAHRDGQCYHSKQLSRTCLIFNGGIVNRLHIFFRVSTL